jgi:hypothetical protein
MRKFRRSDKGQMYTIEGVMAALIMMLVLVLVVKGTAITPLSSSSTNEHVQVELADMGSDLLTSLDYNVVNPAGDSPLKYSILSWNGDQFVWNSTCYKDASNDIIIMNESTNDLAHALNYTFNRYGIAYDVEIIYLDNNGAAIAKSMIWNGNPSDNSVSVSKIIALHNSDSNLAPNFFINTGIPDLDNSTDFYNLLNIRLTLWRM